MEKVIDGKGLLESDLMEASDQQIVGDVAQLGELFHLFGKRRGDLRRFLPVEDLFEVGGIIEGGRVRVHGDVGPVLFEDRPELLPVCGGKFVAARGQNPEHVAETDRADGARSGPGHGKQRLQAGLFVLPEQF